MLLKNKTAVVYGGGGSVGGAIARAFAREGAKVYLAGRTLAPLDEVAQEIHASGGKAETAQIDALDKQSVEDHVAALIAREGHLDISCNCIGILGELQGTPLLEMPAEDFTAPILTAAKTQFLTATAAARYMTQRGSGTILTLSTSSTRLSGRDRRFHKTGGLSSANAATEAFTFGLAGEVGRQGVRVVCLRPDAFPESWAEYEEVHRGKQPKGEVWRYMESGTALHRLPALSDVGNAAIFAASDWAGAMTGTVMNLTCGSIMD